MIKIGSKKLVFSSSFIALDSEVISIRANIEDSAMSIDIVFVGSDPLKEPLGEWKTEDDILKFTFTGWKSSLGTSLNEPAKIGDVNGRNFYFNLSHHFIGINNVVQFFIFVDDV